MNELRTLPADVGMLEHEEAMGIAATESERLLAAVDALAEPDWARQTDCDDWDVKALLGHLLGMFEMQADSDERDRQLSTAARECAASGGLRIDAMTALQVREHADLTPDELRAALHEAAPRGLAARRSTPEPVRAAPFDPEIPGVSGWTIGYVVDVIHTRDPWMHRVDLARATGTPMTLTESHDGRIVADVVAEWARIHDQPFTLELTGPAGGDYCGHGGADPLEIDAVEFCRTLSGRGQGSGLLATQIVF
jgi:uncharacterized protein (TIGR03083 family)